MADQFPDAVRFEPGELHRINRQRLAEKWSIRPDEVDDLPLGDYLDAIGVSTGDAEVAELNKK